MLKEALGALCVVFLLGRAVLKKLRIISSAYHFSNDCSSNNERGEIAGQVDLRFLPGSCWVRLFGPESVASLCRIAQAIDSTAVRKNTR
ncbi:MAG: hypothetical protein OFPII_37280 [Osedax symbiont Rs1]|nr:MAG: hypothetical protein OFPII_37280 [Osedax symbiont Rs1]